MTAIPSITHRTWTGAFVTTQFDLSIRKFLTKCFGPCLNSESGLAMLRGRDLIGKAKAPGS